MAAFAICESCGFVTEFSDPQINERLSLWSDDAAFHPKKITVEIRGLCENCTK
jgi:Fur family zinc uptake transcriptional regulator